MPLIAPHELAVADVLFPPLLLVVALAYLGAQLTAQGLVKGGLHRFVALPVLFELGLTAIYAVVLGTWVIPA
ncbi:DUF1656 domain-containing protein [Ferrimonas balearica]|uniref:DUF1656 domain-containing protein n=1 Tax=Ferrimonas balearica TaxID=44012 RepID=UPI001C992B62|nr:DUF1656 domain-containing protein [Ferrimonas balearica]MBY5992876.1 DUF1656 domain-containing protein [Ferrimonas balearica]